MEIKSYKDVDAWRVAMDLVEATYRFTAALPSDERFGLISQMRRAAISITSNIAEGHAVRAPRWTLRHIVIAIGSSAELETQLEAAVRLRFVTDDAARSLRQLIDREQKILYGMRRERERRIGIVGTSVLLILAALSRWPV
jgi:four helix bundle protein